MNNIIQFIASIGIFVAFIFLYKFLVKHQIDAAHIGLKCLFWELLGVLITVLIEVSILRTSPTQNIITLMPYFITISNPIIVATILKYYIKQTINTIYKNIRKYYILFFIILLVEILTSLPNRTEPIIIKQISSILELLFFTSIVSETIYIFKKDVIIKISPIYITTAYAIYKLIYNYNGYLFNIIDSLYINSTISLILTIITLIVWLIHTKSTNYKKTKYIIALPMMVMLSWKLFGYQIPKFINEYNRVNKYSDLIVLNKNNKVSEEICQDKNDNNLSKLVRDYKKWNLVQLLFSDYSHIPAEKLAITISCFDLKTDLIKIQNQHYGSKYAPESAKTGMDIPLTDSKTKGVVLINISPNQELMDTIAPDYLLQKVEYRDPKMPQEEQDRLKKEYMDGLKPIFILAAYSFKLLLNSTPNNQNNKYIIMVSEDPENVKKIYSPEKDKHKFYSNGKPKAIYSAYGIEELLNGETDIMK